MINIISSEKFKGNSFVAKYDFNTTIIGGGIISLSIACLLSKKYSPVTAKFERGLAGFSSMETTLLSESNSTTPKRSGSETWYPKIVAPLTLSYSVFRKVLKPCP